MVMRRLDAKSDGVQGAGGHIWEEFMSLYVKMVSLFLELWSPI